MKSYKTLTQLSIVAAGLMLSCASTALAAPITVYSTLYGGSGDTDNVLYQSLQTGTSVYASLNTSGTDFIAKFTSPTSLATQGGQASLTASAGGTYNNLTFSLLNDATFTKLIINPDSSANGFITFLVNYIQPAGTFNSIAYTLNLGGQNFFTVIAEEGALITSVNWTSTVGITDANQYRVGGAAVAVTVPDGGATLALLGVGLGAIGFFRRSIGKKSLGA